MPSMLFHSKMTAKVSCTIIFSVLESMIKTNMGAEEAILCLQPPCPTLETSEFSFAFINPKRLIGDASKPPT